MKGAAHDYEGTRGFTEIGRRLDALGHALDQLERAITDAGPQPMVHAETMAKHRAEWPTLWAAIDAVRKA